MPATAPATAIQVKKGGKVWLDVRRYVKGKSGSSVSVPTDQLEVTSANPAKVKVTTSGGKVWLEGKDITLKKGAPAKDQVVAVTVKVKGTRLVMTAYVIVLP